MYNCSWKYEKHRESLTVWAWKLKKTSKTINNYRSEERNHTSLRHFRRLKRRTKGSVQKGGKQGNRRLGFLRFILDCRKLGFAMFTVNYPRNSWIVPSTLPLFFSFSFFVGVFWLKKIQFIEISRINLKN